MSRWRTIFAADFDRWAVECYRLNVPEAERVECADVRTLTLPAADVVLGGPPCQPYSDGGNRLGEADPRDCVPDYLAHVAAVRPRMCLMEQVDGFADYEGGAVLRRAVRFLEDAGYVVAARVLNAADYGVPQHRRRLWVWGIRRDVEARHRWPAPTHTNPATLGSMFGPDLPPWVTSGQALGVRFEGLRRNRSAKVVRRDHPSDEPAPTVTGAASGTGGQLSIVIGGGTNPRFAGDRRTERNITDEPSTTIAASSSSALPAVVRYPYSAIARAKHPPIAPGKPSSTVVASFGKMGSSGMLEIDRDHVRRATPDEAARLQSVPDDWQWPEGISKSAKYRIIGNGWASGMARHMSRALGDADPQSSTVIDLFCGGGLGAAGWHGRAWSYEP